MMMADKNLPSLKLVALNLIDNDGNAYEIFVTEYQKKRAERDSVYARTILDNYRQAQYNADIDGIQEEDIENSCNLETQFFVPAASEVPVASDVPVASFVQQGNEAWSEAETLALINIYGDHKEDFTKARRKKQIWTIISERMVALGYCRSAEKVERKWLNLMMVYRKIKDNKGPRRSGRGLITYKFYDKIDEIIGDKPSNNTKSSVVVEVGSTGSSVSPAIEDSDSRKFAIERDSSCENVFNEEAETSHSECSEEKATTSEEPKQKKQRKTVALVSKEYLEMKKLYLQEKHERQERKLQLEERRLALEEKKIAVLEKYLNT